MTESPPLPVRDQKDRAARVVLAALLLAIALGGVLLAEDPPPEKPRPPAYDKLALWKGPTQLRGANIWQRVVVPDLDGGEFLGDGHVGPPYTQEDFDRLAALGANYVNISGPGIFTMEPPYVLDEELQENLDETLERIRRADMFAVITFRTGPGRSDFTFYRDGAGDWFDEDLLIETVWTDAKAQDAWVEMWRHAARRYRDNPIVVGYDLMCEPNASGALLEIWDPEEFEAEHEGSLYDWNVLHPRITRAIREEDPDTPILVGGMGWSAASWLPFVRPTGDARTVYTAHQYEPQDNYTHQEPPARRGYPGRLDVDGDGRVEKFDHKRMDAFLEPLDDFAEEHGAPVAVNEFGVMRWVPGAGRFLRDEMELFEERGINYALWCFAPEWPPARENDAFDFLHGPDPSHHENVAQSDLRDAVREAWSRNRKRPSNVIAK